MTHSVDSLSVIVTAMDETTSLQETVAGIIDLALSIKTEIIIATSKRADANCIATARQLEGKYPNLVKVYIQKYPFVAAAITEAASISNSDYIVVMAADGETPYEAIPSMISKMIDGVDVVCTSRWIYENSFENYGRIKLILNRSAQILCKIFYPSNLTDYTFGFRLYKKKFLTNIKYKESRHPFFLESILIPIKLGANCVEVPVTWKPRIEGASLATKMDVVQYLRPILRNLL